MPKTKLPTEPIPQWLLSVNDKTLFERNLVLNNSVYYPGSNLDGRFLKIYLGHTHSVVYVDPGVSQEDFLVNIRKISGYEIILCKDLSSKELSLTPLYDYKLLPSDFYPELRSKNEIPNALKNAFNSLTWHSDFTPYANWVVLQRRANISKTHGPERFSMLFIAGEGIATYSAIYNSNLLCPKAIVIKGADIGFGRNWTLFEKRGGIFERVVMSNKAGIPKYLIAWNKYSISGDYWTKEKDIDLYWDKYTIKIQDRGDLNVWTTFE